MLSARQGCMVCGESLPAQSRSDRRYCRGRCRTRAYRLRDHDPDELRKARAEAEALRVHLTKKTDALRAARKRRGLNDTLIRDLRLKLRQSEQQAETLARALREAQICHRAAEARCVSLQEQLVRSQRRAEERAEELKHLQSCLHEIQAKLAQEIGRLRRELVGRDSREQTLRTEAETLKTALEKAQSKPTPPTVPRDPLFAGLDDLLLRPVDAPPQVDAAMRRRIEEAKAQGWRPDRDDLVRAKRRELFPQAHFLYRDKPQTQQASLTEDEKDLQAQRAALEARDKYYERPPERRWGSVSWVKTYQLDARSEWELKQESQERMRRGRT